MKAITLRQPHAWAVIYAGKDVENRTWTRPHRGLLVIHAGEKFERDADLPRGVRYDEDDIVRSAIIGVVDLVDIKESSRSRWWYEGNFAWILRDARPLAKPIPCKGALGLWDVPVDIARKIAKQLGLSSSDVKAMTARPERGPAPRHVCRESQLSRSAL